MTLPNEQFDDELLSAYVDGELTAQERARVEERGPIHSVLVANLKSTRDFASPAATGVLDQLTSDGMHAVDNLRWLAGGEVERVTSHVRTRYIPGPVANTVMAQVEFSSGAVAQ